MAVEPTDPELHTVFVYGTLKRGFHNFSKYLENSGARFVTDATTVERLPLVMDEKYYTPYALNLPGRGEQLSGELFEVTTDVLAVLNRLEGYPKYYDRISVRVTTANGEQEALMYVRNLAECPLDWEQQPLHASYRLEDHVRKYVPREKRTTKPQGVSDACIPLDGYTSLATTVSP